MGNGSLSRWWSGRNVALTTHPHLAPRLKKEMRYTSTPPVGLHDLYIYIIFFFWRLSVLLCEPKLINSNCVLMNVTSWILLKWSGNKHNEIFVKISASHCDVSSPDSSASRRNMTSSTATLRSVGERGTSYCHTRTSERSSSHVHGGILGL